MRSLAPKSAGDDTASCEPTFTPGNPLDAIASLSVMAERQRLERAAAKPVEAPAVTEKPKRSKARKKKVEKSEDAPLPSPPRGWYVVGGDDELEAEIARTWSDRACVCQSEIPSLVAHTIQRTVRVPGREGGSGGVPFLPLDALRARRADTGRRREPSPTQGIAVLCVPISEPSPSGTHMTVRKVALYLPVGLYGAIPQYTMVAFESAALDFCAYLSCGDMDEYKPGNQRYLERRYGQPRLDKVTELVAGVPYSGPKRPRTWAVVRQDLLDRGIIETEPSETSDASYSPGKSSMQYRLTRTWRRAPLAERVVVQDDLPPDQPRQTSAVDGSALESPAWYVRCLDAVEFDLEGACGYLLAWAGAGNPAERTYDGLAAAILAGSPPDWALAEAAAEREEDEERTDAEIVRDSVLSQLAHVWRWRVDRRWSRRHVGVCYRDARGHRLHSPVTSLAGRLRRFLGFAGVRLASIDAKNSQMTILAAACLHAYPNAADVREFAAVCEAGRFYEEAWRTAHEVDCDPTHIERQKWKSSIMGVFLYAHSKVQSHATLALRLAARWPTLHGWMLERKAQDHSDLPCEMQRLEASIWIDRAAPELEARGIPALTVHDSLLFPAQHRDEVEALVRRLYVEAGIRAQFDVKNVE